MDDNSRMKYLCIENTGEVDPQAFTLLGASVKEDEQSIGFFGSGNKYAIASVLREGLELRIFSGTKEIPITTKQQTFRGETFEVIQVNGEPTSITTRTGPKWQIRDAIREFYSNARDEGGCMKSVFNVAEGCIGTTRVFVEMNEEVGSMLSEWGKYFISDYEIPLDDNNYGRIFPPKPANYFRRGVWICEDRHLMGYYTYDFKDFHLPESRKVSSFDASSKVCEVLRWCKSEEVFQTMLDNTTGDLCLAEWQHMAYTTQQTGVLKTLFKQQYDYIGQVASKDFIEGKIDKRILWCGMDSYRGLAYQDCEKIETVLRAEDYYTVTDWPIGYQQQTDLEIRLLQKYDVEINRNKIVFGSFISKDTIAQYDRNKDLIVLCGKSFEFNNLRKSLIEEWTHQKHNCVDGSPHQQNVYLDLICKVMEKH